MSSKFVEMTKICRAYVIRRPIDSAMLNVTVSGSLVYITGVLRKLRSHPNVDLKEEMNAITMGLRQRDGVTDVVWDVSLRE